MSGDETAHRSYDAAVRHAASVLGKAAAEVKAAIGEFYSKVTPRRVHEPKEGAAVKTTVVEKPDIVPPILSGPSVVMEIPGRKPIEVGLVRYRGLDEKKEMADMTRVAVRRIEGTVAMPQGMHDRIGQRRRARNL